MFRTLLRLTTLCVCFLATLAGASRAPAADTAQPDAAQVEFFEKKIRPVLVEQCYKCHSAEARKAGKLRAGLYLDTKAGMLKGGDTGAILMPGKPAESRLLPMLRHEEKPFMPPKTRLDDAIIADFAKWIEMGAPDTRVGESKTVAANEGRDFWSFQPPKKVEPPQVKDKQWAKTGIDRFVFARLETEGLHPVKPAGKRELIRRATFDLIGLPPTPEEVEAFLKDESPQAFEKVVNRLLASPHYGERWGRYWLDVARYAEDQAHTFAVKPNTNAWRYRDWVINAYNDDLPYDRFIKLQIAADLLATDDAERIKQLPALGFFGLGAQYYKNTDAARATADELDDRVDTVTRGFLGLTVACARCHDHKFDPIPTQDYYSLAGVFISSRLADVPLATKEELQRETETTQRRIKEAEEKLRSFLRTEKTTQCEAHASEIKNYLLAVRKYQSRRQEDGKWSVAEQAKQDKLAAPALERWVKYLDGKSKVAALQAWQQLPEPAKDSQDDAAQQAAQQFQDYVQALLKEKAKSPLDNDKTALLQALFGDSGIFTLSDDETKSKLTGEKKKEFDKLQKAVENVRNAKSPLPMAHGMAEGTPTNMKVYLRGNPATQGDVAPRRFLRILSGDQRPEFAHGSGRLDLAEAIASKDNPLTARVMVNRIWQHHFGRGLVGTPSNFGLLGERPTHPELLDYLACRFIELNWSIKALHQEIMLSAAYQLSSERDEQNFSKDGDNKYLWRMNRRRLDAEAWRDSLLAVSGKLDRTFGGPTLDLGASNNLRRTVYAKISRHELNGFLRLFDFPDANISSEKRTETTVPQQQLFVLNSAFVIDQAKALAARVQKDATTDDERLQRAFWLVYGRSASDPEVQLFKRFLAAEDAEDERDKIKLTRWERIAQVLLASNEFLYVD